MEKHDKLIKKLRDLHRDPRPASAEWLFENQVALYDAAAAIEELQAEQKKTVTQIFGEEQIAWEGLCKDLMYQIADLQAQLSKRGEWIYKPKDAIEMMFTLPKCSVCGHESSDANNFCPNCGAKMEETEDEVHSDI